MMTSSWTIKTRFLWKHVSNSRWAST
jgi:hypothetical protein